MMFTRLDYLLVVYVSLTAARRGAAECFPPPRNVSYVWVDPPFHINVTWQPDPSNISCPLSYQLHAKVVSGAAGLQYSVFQYSYMLKRDVVGEASIVVQCSDPGVQNIFHILLLVLSSESDVTYTLKTRTDQDGPCKHYNDSEEVPIFIPHQVPLVNDFKFFAYPPCDKPPTQTQFCGMQATWIPANGTSGLQVLYKARSGSANLSACQVFNSSGLRQGCHLAGAKPKQDVCILFKGVVDGRARHWTYMKKPTDHIRTFPPKVTVAEQGDQLNISWLHPRLCPHGWHYLINYSACNGAAKDERSDIGAKSVLVPFNKDCEYKIQVKPQMAESCGTDFGGISPLIFYNKGAAPKQTLAVAFVAIPTILSLLVVVLCYYIRRKRKTIFTKIPVPPSSLKEMISSIHQSQQQQLFVPVPEEVEVCRVCSVAVESDPLMFKVT